jgi:hypothetical protein
MSPPTVASPPTGVGVVTDLPTLTANQLRSLAEKADGVGGDLSLVKDRSGEVDVVSRDKLDGRTELLRLHTPRPDPGIQGTARIHLRIGDNNVYGGRHTHLDQADAVFVTQSAVEKFLLPYYMRFKSPKEIDAFKIQAFEDPDVEAIIHMPWSWLESFPPVAGVKLRRGALDEQVITIVPL